ncbi:MAG: hypothetical protein WDN66_00350 [Candidatus Saccharibacteria bacterium]
MLLFTHEFRHNTIAYTLSLSNSRSKVLASKIIVISVVAIVATAVIGIFAPLLSSWGVHVHHLKLVHQQFYYLVYSLERHSLWLGYAMIALVFAAIIRNQIGAIVALLFYQVQLRDY